MNLPMRGTADKTIYAKVNGIQLPPKIKKLLIGAEIVWFDKDPMSQDFGEALHFFFDSKTSFTTDLLLKKYGLTDVSQFINIPLRWGVYMDMVYSMPNRQDVDKVHTEHHYFEFHSTLYPLPEKFRQHRDRFAVMCNLQFNLVPDDHKNKKIYETTKFKAVVLGP